MDGGSPVITWLPEPKHTAKSLINNNNGGPGGCIKSIDFIDFFVGQNQKSSLIVPYGSVADVGQNTERSAYLAVQGIRHLLEPDIRQAEAARTGWLFGWRAESKATN